MSAITGDLFRDLVVLVVLVVVVVVVLVVDLLYVSRSVLDSQSKDLQIYTST